MQGDLLNIKGLEVEFAGVSGGMALRGLDLALQSGKVHALVGESGSGKSVSALAVMGLLPRPAARIKAGGIFFKGRDLMGMDAEQRRLLRGPEMAMIFQEAGKHLNPSLTVSRQIEEALILHMAMTKGQAGRRCLELLEMVGMKDAKRVLKSYPHELSGGMKQRALTAMAISCHPALLIADEPTTALDVTIQMRILKLLARLKNALGMAVLFISHDLAIVKMLADRVSVIYAGKVVETADKEEIYRHPAHPYTKLLMNSTPRAALRGSRLEAIRGRAPELKHIPPGCAFHPRCPWAMAECGEIQPRMFKVASGQKAACHLLEDS